VFTDAEYDDALQVIGSTTGPMKSALKPPMPTYMALWQRGDREPAFAELLRGAMASRKRLKAEHDHLEAEETEAARAHRSAARRKLSEKPVYATHVLASLLRANEFYVVAERAVPRHLDPWDRDDIKSELVCALIDGSISIDDAARSGKEFARQFMSRQSRHHCRSLDTSGYESDGEKWVDALSTDDVRIFL
jgi:hypothetical protein